MEGGSSGHGKKGRESRLILKAEMMMELADGLVGYGSCEKKDTSGDALMTSLREEGRRSRFSGSDRVEMNDSI